MKIKRSISAKVVIILIISNIVIMTGLGIISYINQRNQTKKDIDKRAEQILNRLANSLLHPLWYFNNIEIEKIINLEMADENVLAIIIKDENDSFYMGKIRNKKQQVIDYVPHKIDALYFEYELIVSIADSNKKLLLYDSYHKTGSLYLLKKDLDIDRISKVQEILFDLYTQHDTANDNRLKKNILTIKERVLSENWEKIGKIRVFISRKQMTNYLARIIIRIIIQTLIVSIILSIIIFFSLKVMILNPLISLDSVVSSFARGNFEHKAINYQTDDEIGKLAAGFNKMANKINESFATIQQKNKEINQNNEKLEEQVKFRTMELKAANEQKTTFFVNIAHETKTPLTLIKNYLEQYMTKKTVDKELNIIKNNIDKLLVNMINYLDVTKLERNQTVFIHDKIINFSLVVEEKCILFSELAKRKDIAIIREIENDIYLKADPEAADRVVNNLLDNAIKYTDSSGEISIILKLEGDLVLFTVNDTGIGMSQEQCNNIFNPYYQLSHHKKSLQGLGMGLYIVKKITDSLKSEIIIQSEPGKGSSFKIIFNNYTLKKGEEAISDFSTSIPMLIHNSITEVKEENITDSKDNILIIDDNLEMLIFLRDSLKDKFNVYLAENGINALKKLDKISSIEVIISDVMMSEMDGLKFFDTIKSSEKYNNIPFIFLTAKAEEELRIDALSKGALDYIYKPFSIEALNAKLHSIIQNKKTQFNKDLNLIQQKFQSFMQNVKQDSGEEQKELEDRIEQLFYKYHITATEREIIFLILDGLQNKEIAAHLHKSIKTIEKHVYQIYKKLNVKTRVEMVNFFIRKKQA